MQGVLGVNTLGLDFGAKGGRFEMRLAFSGSVLGMHRLVVLAGLPEGAVHMSTGRHECLNAGGFPRSFNMLTSPHVRTIQSYLEAMS